MNVNNKAFTVPYPDKDRYMLMVQSPNGSFVLVADDGAFWSAEQAAVMARRLGYQMIGPVQGLAMLDRQMELRFNNRSPLTLIQ